MRLTASICTTLVLIVACGDGRQGVDVTDAVIPDADTSFSAPAGELCRVGNADPESNCCDAEHQRPVPNQVQTTIDLSDAGSIARGTCGSYEIDRFPYRQGFQLPNDPAAYPLKIVLPANPGMDPACDTVCNQFDWRTAFGIAMETVDLIGGDTGRGLSVLVPAPWRFVSGGCGEACPYPCLGGYQEFGHRSCVTIMYGDFGFATDDPAAPSVDVLVELVTPASPLAPVLCCPYRVD